MVVVLEMLLLLLLEVKRVSCEVRRDVPLPMILRLRPCAEGGEVFMEEDDDDDDDGSINIMYTMPMLMAATIRAMPAIDLIIIFLRLLIC